MSNSKKNIVVCLDDNLDCLINNYNNYYTCEYEPCRETKLECQLGDKYDNCEHDATSLPTFLYTTIIPKQVLFTEDNLHFNKNITKMGSIDLDINSSENLLIWEAGYYHIYFNFNIHHIEQKHCRFSLFLNNVLIPESTVGSSQNSATEIIYINSDDILYYETRQSPSGMAACLNVKHNILNSNKSILNNKFGSGSIIPQITACVSLFKLSK